MSGGKRGGKRLWGGRDTEKKRKKLKLVNHSQVFGILKGVWRKGKIFYSKENTRVKMKDSKGKNVGGSILFLMKAKIFWDSSGGARREDSLSSFVSQKTVAGGRTGKQERIGGKGAREAVGDRIRQWWGSKKSRWGLLGGGVAGRHWRLKKLWEKSFKSLSNPWKGRGGLATSGRSSSWKLLGKNASEDSCPWNLNDGN